jgi:hypothetical protein
MSSLSYLLTTAFPAPDFGTPVGQYTVPTGWILGFGAEARITGPARIEGALFTARDRWQRALAGPDPYLRGVLGPLRLLLDHLEGEAQAWVAIDASELLGLNPQNDGFMQRLTAVSEPALAAIQAGDRAAAVAQLNRWFDVGSVQFSGSGAKDREWAMSTPWLLGDSPEARWAPLIVGEADRPGWYEASIAAVQFID